MDALLECLPTEKKSGEAYRSLFFRQRGAALACPYCNGLIAFDDDGRPQIPPSGWPVFRYGLAELELKKQQAGEPSDVTVADWALRQRFVAPGLHLPFTSYQYAEQSTPNETVP